MRELVLVYKCVRDGDNVLVKVRGSERKKICVKEIGRESKNRL